MPNSFDPFTCSPDEWNKNAPQHLRETQDERELAKVEQSWADFVRHTRTNQDIRFAKSGNTIGTQTLLATHEHLNAHRKAFEAGDKFAVLMAVKVCAEQNVPLPYWCASAFSAQMKTLAQGVQMRSGARVFKTAAEVFGTSKHYAETKGKSDKKRITQQATKQDVINLFVAYKKMKGAHPELSMDACLTELIANGATKYKKRNARSLLERFLDDQKLFDDYLASM